MCQCFEGQEVDWENLRSPEQQNMMESLYYQLMKGGKQGATQFTGQLNAPMVDAQKMAMKTMAKQGGYGWEQQSPKYKPVPNMYNPENINDLPVRGGGGGGGITPYYGDKGGTVTTGTKKQNGGGGLPPPGPPGPDPKPDPDDLVIQLLAMMGMGGSPYDPRNPMG